MKCLKPLVITLLAFAVRLAFAAVEMPALSWTPSNDKVAISGDIATVALPGTTKQSGYVRTTFDMSAFAGKAFELTVNARLSGVAGATYSWEGLKFQFSFRDELRGKDNNIDGALPQKTGTTDGWITLTLRFDPSRFRATSATLALGIQQAYGTAIFDLSTLAIRETPAVCEPVNENYIVAYPADVAALPPLRGVMSPTGDMNEGDFRTLHDWGATLLRFEMANCPPEAIANIPASISWIRGRLDHLENVILPCAEKYGIKVIVDMHNTIGGRVGGYSDFALFDDDDFCDTWLDLWREIAMRFKGDKNIYGYDLCNEPNQTAAHKRNYWQIQQAATEAIREIDPDATIVMEANAADAPDAFYYLSPLSADNVVYQVHMYEPGTYTHQGLDGNPTGQTYPGTLPNGSAFDKAWLYEQLAPVRAFQLKHNARILVGEFSAICWAPQAEDYLKDLTDIFNEYGWDWCYMAFRAWGGWSLEHQERTAGEATLWDFTPSPDNPRKAAILAAFADGAQAETVTDYLRLESGSSKTLNNITNDNPASIQRIVFAGGSLRGTSFDGHPLCTANGARWLLESESGAPILIGDIGVQRFHWHTGDGFIETRGNADIVLYTTSYDSTYGRGIVWFDDARTAWDHTGDFVLSNAVKVVCRADDCLPHGNDTGGVRMTWVNRNLPEPLLDLAGHRVAVNELNAVGGGIVTNSAFARATVRLGENDLGGMVSLGSSQDCRNIDIEKTGAGQNGLDVGSSSFGNVRIDGGRFLVRGAESDTVSVDALSLAAGARLIVKNSTLHAASFSPGGSVELQGTGQILYDALVVEQGAPLALDAAETCAAVRLRDTLTLASGGLLAAGTAVVVDGPGGGLVMEGGSIPSTARLSLAAGLESNAEYATVLDLRSGATTLQCATNANPALAARILFSGGTLRGTSFSGTPLCAANGGKWILEGGDGCDIVIGELGLQRILWLAGEGGIETRGDCDVVIYDNQYNAENDYRGTIYFNTSDTTWNHSGDLVLSNAVRAICRADDCLPAGPQTGIVRLKSCNPSIPAPVLDLNGRTIAVNGIDVAEGGIVTNSANSTATLRIGENGRDGEVALPPLAGANIALVKRGDGTNAVSLASASLPELRIEEGTLILSGASGDASRVGSLSVAEGARLVLDGVSLTAEHLAVTGAVESVGSGGLDFARNPWFFVDGATGSVRGGGWDETPPRKDGAYMVDGQTATFAARESRREYPRVELAIAQDEAWPAEMLGVLLQTAVDQGVKAAVVAALDGEGAACWHGMALAGGVPKLVELHGASPATGEMRRIAVEFDFTNSSPLVSYLAEGSGGELVRLADPSGKTWLPMCGSVDSGLEGRVVLSGSAALGDLTGTSAEPQSALSPVKGFFMIVR